MITLTREEAQQVLECMETAIKAGDWVVDGACDPDFILYMLRARLAQPEPKPVAWLYRGDGMVQVLIKRNDHFFSLDEGENFIKGEPLYTAPPQREWQGLTDEEIYACSDTPWTPTGLKCIRAIEAKLKEKNT